MENLRRMLHLLICAGMLTLFSGCAATQKHESTGQYVDDSVITVRVKAALFHEETLKTLQISVRTFRGVVQLSGFVDSSQDVLLAGETARRVEGVMSVENGLIAKNTVPPYVESRPPLLDFPLLTADLQGV